VHIYALTGMHAHAEIFAGGRRAAFFIMLIEIGRIFAISLASPLLYATNKGHLILPGPPGRFSASKLPAGTSQALRDALMAYIARPRRWLGRSGRQTPTSRD
jgi:hypothetical protein